MPTMKLLSKKSLTPLLVPEKKNLVYGNKLTTNVIEEETISQRMSSNTASV